MFDDAVERVRGGAPVEAEARRLYDELTDDERLGLLDGDREFWDGLVSMMAEGYNLTPYTHGAVERLGIPGIRFVDGPRGCVAGHGTAFPVAMARGATWDVELEAEVGATIAREIRAQGGNFWGGVCVNLLRHPAWGRAQETYGDDPHHLGEMGAAAVRGAQRYVMTCGKHFALNSMENARFTVDVAVDEATLHDVYLPHFRRLVDEGAAAIMGSYNSVNGEWAGQNPMLLTGVLRDLWGFDGITVTDFIWGMRDGGAALVAGMDLEEPFAQQRATKLRGQIDAGHVGWEHVERAALRLLGAQLRSYAARVADVGAVEMASDESRALARRVATRSMVLLKNEPIADGGPLLPIDPANVRSVAVIGRLAREANLGDSGSSNVRPPSFVTPVDGIGSAFPGAKIVVSTDDDPAAAAWAAELADVAVVVVGYDARDEGEYVGSDTIARPELLALFPALPDDFGDRALAIGDAVMTSGDGFGGDRSSLSLRPVDEDIIRATAAANPRTVVVLVAAGAVLTGRWRADVPAVLLMWYAGMDGGHALADVLTGAANPSGRLPFSIPTSPDHLPYFDPDATAITYDRWHGQRLIDRLEAKAAFPHGFGLSYTTFEIGPVVVGDAADETVPFVVTVTNTGERDGHHVVQVYGRSATGPYAGEQLLCGFAAVEVPAGESATVPVEVSLLPLAAWDASSRRRVTPSLADVTFEVGAHAHDPAAITITNA